jgi:POT family proton-dependent oligopeptide transporter
MWERFGFYLLNALLAFYLTERMHFSPDRASDWIGNYLMLVYLSPFFGGLLADRYLGYRRAVLIGAAFLSAGYFMLAMDSTVALYSAVFLLVIGNGLFKPNISTQVGNLYPQGDSRRDSAFSIFYLGINIGAFLSPFVGGIVRQHYGFGAAFSTAGFGMIASMVIFSVFHHHVAVANKPSSLSAVLDVPLPQEYEDPRDPPELERKRIIAVLIICGIVMLFWMAFQQNAITLSFWARDNTQRLINLPAINLSLGLFSIHRAAGPYEIPPEWFQAVNPVFILTLTPILVSIFGWLRKYNREPSTPVKLALGMILTGLSYMFMVGGSLAGGDNGQVSMWWLNVCYFVITIGELCLSPIGLSLIAKLAPRRMTAMLMGVWFIATSIGNKLAGKLGSLWSSWPHSRFFALLVLSSFLAALLLRTQFRRLHESMPPEGPPKEADPPAPAVELRTAGEPAQPQVATAAPLHGSPG